MNIVFFYSEVVGYTESLFNQLLLLNNDIKIDVVFWDKKKLSQYKIGKDKKISYWPRSEYNNKSLLELLEQKEPKILFVSGWMDKGYLKAIFKYKKKNKNLIVICGTDNHWKGNIRQRLGQIIFKVHYNFLFDYLWIAGKPQYHFSKMMGYPESRILHNLYSANSNLFTTKSKFSRRFVYLGRLSPEKGVIYLVKAYEKLPEELKRTWPLVLIGSGPDQFEIEKIKSNNVILKGFLQGNELTKEIEDGGVLCYPSLRGQWGVAIHEMALNGYPLLISRVCGATSEFLIDGYNGFSFDIHKEKDLVNSMLKIGNLSEEDLIEFGNRSHVMGQRINSEISAASFLSVLHKK